MTSGTSPLSVIGAHALLSGSSIYHTHLDCCIPGRCILTLALILAGSTDTESQKKAECHIPGVLLLHRQKPKGHLSSRV